MRNKETSRKKSWILKNYVITKRNIIMTFILSSEIIILKFPFKSTFDTFDICDTRCNTF